jgi:hypothetical protein
MTLLLGCLPANQFETFIVIGGGEDMESSRAWRMIVLKRLGRFFFRELAFKRTT